MMTQFLTVKNSIARKLLFSTRTPPNGWILTRQERFCVASQRQKKSRVVWYWPSWSPEIELGLNATTTTGENKQYLTRTSKAPVQLQLELLLPNCASPLFIIIILIRKGSASHSPPGYSTRLTNQTGYTDALSRCHCTHRRRNIHDPPARIVTPIDRGRGAAPGFSFPSTLFYSWLRLLLWETNDGHGC